MAKFELAPPLATKLPSAPKEYDQAYMQRLIKSLEDQILQLTQPRQVLAAGIVTYNMPTVADLAALKSGEVYIDGTGLKVVP